jgi:transcriptional regulator with XRE-family HTH domain
MQKETFLTRQIIGENIRKNRKRLGLSQGQFAEKVGLSTQFLSVLETGSQFAKMDTYCKIADAIGVPLYVLFQEYNLHDDALYDEIRLLFYNCENDTKDRLYNIIKEIIFLIHKYR